jgi:hypothetical protein
MVFQEHGDTMPTHGLFRQGAAALRHEVAVFQSNGLFVQAGITDDGGRDLRFVGLDDAYAVFGKVLVSQVEGIAVDYRLDHWRV